MFHLKNFVATCFGLLALTHALLWRNFFSFIRMKSSIIVAVFHLSVSLKTEQISDLIWSVFVMFLQSRECQLN